MAPFPLAPPPRLHGQLPATTPRPYSPMWSVHHMAPTSQGSIHSTGFTPSTTLVECQIYGYSCKTHYWALPQGGHILNTPTSPTCTLATTTPCGLLHRGPTWHCSPHLISPNCSPWHQFTPHGLPTMAPHGRRLTATPCAWPTAPHSTTWPTTHHGPPHLTMVPHSRLLTTAPHGRLLTTAPHGRLLTTAPHGRLLTTHHGTAWPTAHHSPRHRMADCSPRHHMADFSPRHHTADCLPRHHMADSSPRHHMADFSPRHHTADFTPRHHMADYSMAPRGRFPCMRSR